MMMPLLQNKRTVENAVLGKLSEGSATLLGTEIQAIWSSFVHSEVRRALFWRLLVQQLYYLGPLSGLRR